MSEAAGKRRALADLSQNSRTTGAEQQGKRRRNETTAPASTSGGSSSDVFAELLVSGGMQLAQLSSAADGSGSNGAGAVLQGLPCTQHPSVLRRHLSAALEHEPATAAAFISGFAELLAAEQEWLQRALLPLAVEVEVGISGVVQDSLVKVLLRVDCIQSQVMKLLVEKLSELAMAADGDDSGGAGTQDLSQDLPRLILTQMRWLDHLVDPGGLTEKLLEVLPVLPLALERDLIAYLPEVVMENNEALVQVIRCLSEEQQAKPSLLVAVLDAYCSMPLPADLLQTITADVLQLLPSAEHATLPMLVRFLLESAGADNMADVVRELRAKLRLSSAAPPDSQEDGMNEGTATVACMGSNLKQLQDARSSNDALTLEALRHGLQMRPDVAAAFVAAIREGDRGASGAVVDIWALFCLHGLPDWRSRAASLLQKKASAGQFAEPLLADAVQGRAAALGGLFDSMLQLADHLARSGEPLAERCGGALYTLLFREFTDAARRQDVVGALLVNAGSGAASEVNCALATLTALANRGTADDPTTAGVGASPLRPFATMIKSLVQYLSGFTDAQARRVFNLLLLATLTSDDGSGGGGGSSSSAAAAAATRHDGGNDGLDDVHIFIRKQLSHSHDPTMRRIGIIGAVAFASYKAKRNPNAKDEATSTLQMLFSSCDDNKELVAFLYDELATSITKGLMDRDLVDWLSDAINDEPLHLFLCEMIEDTGKIADSVPIQYCNGEIEVRIMFDLDPVEIAFNPTFVLDHTEASATSLSTTYFKCSFDFTSNDVLQVQLGPVHTCMRVLLQH